VEGLEQAQDIYNAPKTKNAINSARQTAAALLSSNSKNNVTIPRVQYHPALEFREQHLQPSDIRHLLAEYGPFSFASNTNCPDRSDQLLANNDSKNVALSNLPLIYCMITNLTFFELPGKSI